MMHGLEVYDNVLSSESCELIIKWFNQSSEKQPGRMYKHGRAVVTDNKKSTDLYCYFSEPKHKQCSDLIQPAVSYMIEDMKVKYPFLNYTEPWRIQDGYNIQYYTDNEGFFTYHCEQGRSKPLRMLAWMLYLNTAQCGTIFPYQDVELRAIQGRGAMWSAAWTHPHKGVTPNVGDKYIITGWCEYLPPD